MKNTNLTLVLLGVLVMGTVAWGRGLEDEVRAKKFYVINDAGKEIAMLASIDNLPMLVFYNSDGEIQMVIGLSHEQNPHIMMAGEGQVPTVGISRQPSGDPQIILHSRAGTSTIGTIDGSPGVTVRSRTRMRADMAVNDSAATIALVDQNGKPRVGMRTSGSDAILLVADENGNPIATLP